MKKCPYCKDRGDFEISMGSHSMFELCEYCNGTGKYNKKQEKKINKELEKEKSKYRESVSPYVEIDKQGLMAC